MNAKQVACVEWSLRSCNDFCEGEVARFDAVGRQEDRWSDVGMDDCINGRMWGWPLE